MSQQATLNNYFLRQKKPEAPEIKAKPAVQPYVKPEPRVTPQPTEEELKLLRAFDLQLEYGPCVGVPRLDRWKRAERLGLEPEPLIRELIEKYPESETVTESLWNDQVL